MRFLSFFILCGILVFQSPALAQDQATPDDVFRLVINAYDVVKALGDESLPAFNDPAGEFVFKDTYVFVLQCPEYAVAHPYALDKLKGKDLRGLYDFHNHMCEGGEDPYGQWIEYMWPKPGSKEPSRKISFSIRVKGTPYTLVAGIYNEDADIEELNKKLKQK